jgi:hypothetical protein
MTNLLELLQRGDMRTNESVDEVVHMVEDDPKLFASLIDAMKDTDKHVRMRASDAVEKLSLTHPEWLQVYKNEILNEVAKIDQQEVQWHMCQIIPHLKLNSEERIEAYKTIENYFKTTKSRIVMAFSLQALVQLGLEDGKLLAKAKRLLSENAMSDIPAVKVRVRNLQEYLSKL